MTFGKKVGKRETGFVVLGGAPETPEHKVNAFVNDGCTTVYCKPWEKICLDTDDGDTTAWGGWATASCSYWTFQQTSIPEPYTQVSLKLKARNTLAEGNNWNAIYVKLYILGTGWVTVGTIVLKSIDYQFYSIDVTSYLNTKEKFNNTRLRLTFGDPTFGDLLVTYGYLELVK